MSHHYFANSCLAKNIKCNLINMFAPNKRFVWRQSRILCICDWHRNVHWKTNCRLHKFHSRLDNCTFIDGFNALFGITVRYAIVCCSCHSYLYYYIAMKKQKIRPPRSIVLLIVRNHKLYSKAINLITNWISMIKSVFGCSGSAPNPEIGDLNAHTNSTLLTWHWCAVCRMHMCA